MTGPCICPFNAVTMLFCPVDAELGLALYPAPCQFGRMTFKETLACGYFPTGAVVKYALDYRGTVTRWRASGSRLLEVDGERVLAASFAGGEHVRVALVMP